MENKAWPWKKKSMEKTENIGVSSIGEIEKLVADKLELENCVKSLNDKLTSIAVESNKHEIEAKEETFVLEKTKAESESLKKKLEQALNEKRRSEERLSHTDAGLKECSQQLRFVRAEQERRIHDALRKSSQEYEQRLIVLADTVKRLEGENGALNREKDHVVADFNALVRSLESKEKENVSLRYEVRVLEKELELRDEEREFNRRNAEASHKLHLENVKKVAKLEEECQRLRILVRKRLPGPTSTSKMKNEVETLGRRRSHPSPMVDTEKVEQLQEENKTLKEALNKKINELQFSRTMYSRTAARLLEFESRIEESSKGTNIDPSLSSIVSHEVSISEFDNDDKVSCADSWASALLSEMDNFKNKKQISSNSVKTSKALEMKLMDDFAEMEKLAMVIENRPENSPVCSSDSISVQTKTLIVEESPEIDGKSIQIENQPENSPTCSYNSISGTGLIENETQISSDSTKTLIVEETPEIECDIDKSIRKVIEIIEGISLKDEKNAYTARILQWKTSELSKLLFKFLQTCYELLNKKSDMKKFTEELSSVMEWLVNHCFSLQDVSSMRDEIKKQLEWDESRSGSEVEVAILGRVLEVDKVKTEDVLVLDCEDKLVEDKVEEVAKDKTVSGLADEVKIHENQNMRAELEITAASEKLAECQETILNLGKQLKALTISNQTLSLPDNLTTENPTKKTLTTQRSSLLEQMKAEDNETEESKPQAKSGGGGSSSVYNETIEALEKILLSDKSKDFEGKCFDIVKKKGKSGGGGKSLWRKLLGRKRTSKSIKIPNPFAM